MGFLSLVSRNRSRLRRVSPSALSDRTAAWNDSAVSFTTPESVPAGMARRVLEVQGHPPRSLADFDGDVAFIIDDESRHEIQGSGRVIGDMVRFHEKDRADGKDIRVWGIRQEAQSFLAEQTPSF
jgi:hypothetical protein